MPAVHTSDDGCSEDLPLAVHRVQVLQRLWNLRERREPSYDIPNLCVLSVSKKNVLVEGFCLRNCRSQLT